MSRIKISEFAKTDLNRIRIFLEKFDQTTALDAVDTLLYSIQQLTKNHFAGAPVPERISVRKLVVPFGSKGYLIFHKYYEATDTTLILAIIHQKELYSTKSIGLDAEEVE
jgi:plasmid stabilization system protein ParE